jgi:hypothetical protein
VVDRRKQVLFYKRLSCVASGIQLSTNFDRVQWEFGMSFEWEKMAEVAGLPLQFVILFPLLEHHYNSTLPHISIFDVTKRSTRLLLGPGLLLVTTSVARQLLPSIALSTWRPLVIASLGIEPILCEDASLSMNALSNVSFKRLIWKFKLV